MRAEALAYCSNSSKRKFHYRLKKDFLFWTEIKLDFRLFGYKYFADQISKTSGFHTGQEHKAKENQM